MLRPTKHSHPDKTLIYVALLVLARIKARRLEDYETLRQYTKKSAGGRDVLFLTALSFLYLLALIDYRPKTDSVEYVGPNEAH